MAKFIVLYRSSVLPGDQMVNATPEQAQAGMDAWMQWAGKAGPALIDLGAPLSPIATVGQAASDAQPVCGFSILEADSGDEVANLIEGHPHFLSPGDNSIEVLEFVQIPGM